MKAQTVIQCVDSLHIGGTELNAVRTSLALARRNVNVIVAVLNGGPLSERLREANIPIYHFSVRSFKHWSALTCARAFAKFCVEQRADVVHCHDVYTNALFGMVARVSGIRRVIVSRRWGIDQHPRPLTLASRLSYRFAHLVLANSRQGGLSVQHDERVAAERTIVVPNFVDDELFEADSNLIGRALRHDLGIPETVPVITIVARLSIDKDHLAALEAMVRIRVAFPTARMVFVGDGPMHEAIKQRIDVLGLGESVLMVGERAAGWRYYCAANIAMLTSVREGFPNTLVEAMALARPVIATAVGGVGDAVEHDVTGLLISARSVADIADAAIALLTDPDRAQRMGAAGHARAREAFSERVVIDKLLNAYE